MKLLYPEEHLVCINYEKGENPIIEVVSIEKDKMWENISLGNKLVFILDGEISFSLGTFTDCQIGKMQILYIPTGYNFSCRALENCRFIVMSIQGQARFCDDYNFAELEKDMASVTNYTKASETKPLTLEINSIVEKYLDALLEIINLGARCRCFYQIKVKELFFIFRWFYPKETLIIFFQNALKSGKDFSSYIMESWHKYRSVGELAEAMNYTVSGFEKRFKRIFGISPYKWMINKKSELIFHQLRTSDLTLKQISSNFGFSSLSHFNDFCKSHLGKSPGEIREKSRIGGNHE